MITEEDIKCIQCDDILIQEVGTYDYRFKIVKILKRTDAYINVILHSFDSENEFDHLLKVGQDLTIEYKSNISSALYKKFKILKNEEDTSNSGST